MRVDFPDILIRASAGSGKTHALTSRLLSLLKLGVAPETILATTFTRKAAGEIRARLILRLLDDCISENKEVAKLAFQVLTRLVESQHRLQICTMDAFCVAIGHCFSLELGIPTNWTILDDAAEAERDQRILEELFNRNDSAAIGDLVQAIQLDNADRSVASALRYVVDFIARVYREAPPDVWGMESNGTILTVDELNAYDKQLAGILAPLTKAGKPHKSWQKSLDELKQLLIERNFYELVDNGIVKKLLSGEGQYYGIDIPESLTATWATVREHLRALWGRQLKIATEACYALGLQSAKLESEWSKQRAQFSFGEIKALVGAASENIELASLFYRLDGHYQHLLLDEFQDTSLEEWRVLEPLASEILSQESSERSFLCVGDPKQAIYGWRGGVPEIFDSLHEQWPHLQQLALTESRRSAPVVIDFVNKICGELESSEKLAEYPEALAKWKQLFDNHSTVRAEDDGFVTYELVDEEENADLQDSPVPVALNRAACCAATLARENPEISIGILFRSNEGVALMLQAINQTDLRGRVSGERGARLIDSPCVQVVLALLQLIEHPGDSVARYIVCNSPLGKLLGIPSWCCLDEIDQCVSKLRNRIFTEGLGEVLTHIERLVSTGGAAAAELPFLAELAALAYTFKLRNGRLDEFIRLVKTKGVDLPSQSGVRVMTIHQSKGLEFDAVILPELDAPLIRKGRRPALLVHRDSPLGPVRLVTRAPTSAHLAVEPKLQSIEHARFENEVLEAFCVLYVALTRARQGLYMFAPAKHGSQSFAGILCAALKLDVCEPKVVFKNGVEDWHRHKASKGVGQIEVNTQFRLQLKPAVTARILPRITPSKLAKPRDAGEIFRLSSDIDRRVGLALHEMLATVSFIDAKETFDDELLSKICSKHGVPQETVNRFKSFIFSSPERKHFEEQCILGAFEGSSNCELWRERPFLVHDGDVLLSGVFDRVTFAKTKAGTFLGAKIVDFKTGTPNKSSSENNGAYYAPQLDCYVRALSLLTMIPADRISAEIVRV